MKHKLKPTCSYKSVTVSDTVSATVSSNAIKLNVRYNNISF